MLRPLLESLSDPFTRAVLTKNALARLGRAYSKTLARLNGLRDREASPGSVRHGLAAIMQWRNDKRRLRVSFDAAELAEIIERIGPKGSPLPVPAMPNDEPDNDTVYLLPKGAGQAVATLMERVAHEGWDAVFRRNRLPLDHRG